jgi:hypothetical protein
MIWKSKRGASEKISIMSIATVEALLAARPARADSHPNTEGGVWTCSGTGSRLVTNEYLTGPAGTVAGNRLVGVDFYTAGPGITYYPNGMVSGVTHFNNVTAAYGRDPNGLARPAPSARTLGRLGHLQINWWRAGVKESGRVIRIPFPWDKA